MECLSTVTLTRRVRKEELTCISFAMGIGRSMKPLEIGRIQLRRSLEKDLASVIGNMLAITVVLVVAGCATTGPSGNQRVSRKGLSWVVDYQYRISAEDLSSARLRAEMGNLHSFTSFCTWDDDFGIRGRPSFAHSPPSARIVSTVADASQVRQLKDLEAMMSRGLNSGRWMRYADLFDDNDWNNQSIRAVGYMTYSLKDVTESEDYSAGSFRADLYLVVLEPGSSTPRAQWKYGILGVPSERHAEWVWVFDAKDTEGIFECLSKLIPKESE